MAESIPFVELTGWNHQRLYDLKGEIVRRGVEAITGLSMPDFEKRRFQHGAVEPTGFAQIFPEGETAYREVFAGLLQD